MYIKRSIQGHAVGSTYIRRHSHSALGPIFQTSNATKQKESALNCERATLKATSNTTCLLS